ncbi:MAG TPA: hypothetical protein ENJ73_02580, partial [Desulfobacterales bacterium]|nr:hypothetical protein [Desulfobacterales bacterium]
MTKRGCGNGPRATTNKNRAMMRKTSQTSTGWRHLMRREPFCVVLFSLLTLLLLLTSPPRLSAAPLTIGLLPEMNVFQQMKRYQPLAEYIEKQLGAPVRLQMVSRYGNITENIKKKRVDAIFIGSFTGALCITQLNLHP